mmetsp:Transcript_20076/g.27131  ORF Transcript_20076/g.27131 Transcript_20076/m.27131 type:complete len:83 (+) Transcript_20076:349-597(+)
MTPGVQCEAPVQAAIDKGEAEAAALKEAHAEEMKAALQQAASASAEVQDWKTQMEAMKGKLAGAEKAVADNNARHETTHKKN